MANVAVLRNERAEAPKARDYLGPAEVTAVRAQEVEVRLPNGEARRALLALGYLYEPRVADVLLVIGNEDGHYVIGVLRGSGKSTIAVPGDVELRAVDGVLRLAGDKGVAIDAPDVQVRAGKLRVLADAVSETFSSLRQHVSDLLSVRAGKAHTVVEGSSYTQAKSATVLTEEKIAINGKEIHLG